MSKDSDREVTEEHAEPGAILAMLRRLPGNGKPMQTLNQATEQACRSRLGKSGQKTQTTLRISQDLPEYFRAIAPGWQTRMTDALKRYVASQRR